MNSINFNRARRQYGMRQILSPFAGFVRQQTSAGVLLLIFTVVAILSANIPALEGLYKFWATDLSLSFSYNPNFLPMRTVGDWVNNALMVVFFFSLGLEIKREMVVGELSSLRHAMLPIFAAVGGMLAPGLIYFYFNAGTVGEQGWGIPMATDIALTIGLLAILGKRVPTGVKVFLTALAIAVDLGSIVVMALFYPTHVVYVEYLIAAALVLGVLILINRMGVNRTFPYVILGIVLWFLTLRSGVHATIAGVALAMTIPANIRVNQVRFYVRSKYMLERFRDAYKQSTPLLKNKLEQQQLHNLTSELRRSSPLLLRLEHSLQPWVAFCIMPIFALSNAAVVINPEALAMLAGNPVAIGIFLGLLVGKPIGITLMSWITIKLGLASMPYKTRWAEMVGASILAGVGFTVSIFINTIAFSSEIEVDMQNVGKQAIIISSLLAAAIGLIYMKIVCKKEDRRTI